MEEIYTPKSNYKVLVRCFTYNQSKYIKEALNGFAMQKTNFPFVCLVVDDCSTDGEQEVIKAWMERECDMEKADYIDLELSNVILVPHKTNENCTFAFYLLKQNLYGTRKKMPLVTPWREQCEYEAPCEGDDFWKDPEKLQLQVDALDNNKQCTICVNKVCKVDSLGSLVPGTFPMTDARFEHGIISSEKYIKEEFYKGQWNFQLSGCMFRMENLRTAVERYKTVFAKYPFGDIPMILSHFLDGDGYYIDKEMSCYRVMSGGYNSTMTANPEKAIANQERIKAAMDEIDEYTNCKYHKAFMHNKLWCDLHIFYMKNPKAGKLRSFLEKIKPHYWPLFLVFVSNSIRNRR